MLYTVLGIFIGVHIKKHLLENIILASENNRRMEKLVLTYQGKYISRHSHKKARHKPIFIDAEKG